MHAIVCSDESNYTLILEEINAVLVDSGTIIKEETEDEGSKNIESNPSTHQSGDPALHTLKEKSDGKHFLTEEQTKCAKTIFNVIDFIIKYLKEWADLFSPKYYKEWTDATFNALTGRFH